VTTALPDPKKNQLLAALPDAEWQRWRPQLEAVELPLGQVLYESGSTLSHVYFPTTALVSLLFVMENGASAEIAVVGNEGVVGISLFMGGESTPSRAVVQSAGEGFRLPAQAIRNEASRAGPVLQLLLRYTQALITQMTQTAACNRRTPRRRNRSCPQVAEGRIDPLRARPHHSAGSAAAGATYLRVLCRGEEGIRQAAPGDVGALACARNARVLVRSNTLARLAHLLNPVF